MAGIARRERSTNIWPGFVDALATLLMVIIFLLMVFVLAQFFLSEALSGRDQALDRLRGQVTELAELLALERKANTDLRLNLAQLSDELQASVADKDDLRARLQSMTLRAEEAEEESGKVKAELQDAFETIMADREKIETQMRELAALTQNVEQLKSLKAELEKEVANLSGRLDTSRTTLAKEKEISDAAKAQVALLNRQLDALRQQIANLNKALEVSEELNEKQKVQIANLGQRLNAALATKVQELSRYRSEFFGKLREVLGDRRDIRIVGDRFVFQSEVLFSSGSAELGEPGQVQISQLADTLKELMGRIPEELDWVLRVDGHTDKAPIRTAQFPSNWELSTARAVSVVKFLIDQGIPPGRLAATGFGEFQPIDGREDEIAYRRNRRIEFKLTER